MATGSSKVNEPKESDNHEEDNASLRDRYHRFERAFLEERRNDQREVEIFMERERLFTVEYNRMSRNRLWASSQSGKPVVFYEGTVEEYKHRQKIWPNGRDLKKVSVFCQIWDFFRFMWSHTKPYKTVFLIVLIAAIRPVNNFILAYVAQDVQKDPLNTPLWLYFTPLYSTIGEKFLRWWYEFYVPLNSQRVQMRSVLISKRVQLPDSHPLAKKWSPGRFNGLLKDVDEVVNGIWRSCLKFFDGFVTIIYLVVLCLLNLSMATEGNDPYAGGGSFGAYVGVFLTLGIFTIMTPVLWFTFFFPKLSECETMVRDAQKIYMSLSTNAVGHAFDKNALFTSNNNDSSFKTSIQRDDGALAARKTYRLYGMTTFRRMFHSLAWTTNFDLLSNLVGPLVAYGLLTAEGFGQGFNLTSTLIVLLSLNDLSSLSRMLLDDLIKMSRGCNTLVDVADLLNADFIDDSAQESTASLANHVSRLVEDNEFFDAEECSRDDYRESTSICASREKA